MTPTNPQLAIILLLALLAIIAGCIALERWIEKHHRGDRP